MIVGRILWFIIVALIVFWLLGLIFKIGGGLIHIILVVAGIIFILQLITGRRSV
ncbi:lmo0937 family membrane protein [Sporosarcina sp. Marseille-Q4063]|uniref:lmo0937 family membrane protein n=1 Tax=Sporosarcina sp. Marseille-Q4063 TaxID=2810514 RepID=UPI0035300443